jgi:hypothetical protein
MDTRIKVINAFDYNASMVYTLSYKNELYDVYADDEIESFSLLMDHLNTETLDDEISSSFHQNLYVWLLSNTP